MTPPKQRELWIDALRGLAMLMVVLGHSIAESIMYHNPAPDRIAFASGWIDTVGLNNIPYNLIASVYMPLFAFVSGVAGSSGSLRVTWRTVVRRAKQLMVPYFAWPLLAIPLLMLPTFLKNPEVWLEGVARSVIDPRAGLWFLYAIFAIQVLAAVVTSISEHPRFLVLSAVAAIAVRLFLSKNYFAAQDATMFYPFFCLGMLERRYGFLKQKRWLWAAIVAYPVTLALRWPTIVDVQRWWLGPATALLMRVPRMPGSVAQWSVNITQYLAIYVLAAAGIILLYNLYLKMPRPALEFQAPVGQRTIGIYAIHYHLIYALLGAGVTSATLLFLISGSVAFILTLAIERVPVASTLLLGKPARRWRTAATPA